MIAQEAQYMFQSSGLTQVNAHKVQPLLVVLHDLYVIELGSEWRSFMLTPVHTCVQRLS